MWKAEKSQIVRRLGLYSFLTSALHRTVNCSKLRRYTHKMATATIVDRMESMLSPCSHRIYPVHAYFSSTFTRQML